MKDEEKQMLLSGTTEGIQNEEIEAVIFAPYLLS
jgi:hypothetical protein